MWCQEPMSSCHHSCPLPDWQRSWTSPVSSILGMWFFVYWRIFFSDHCLCWDKSSKLSGFLVMWQTFRQIAWELELNSVTDTLMLQFFVADWNKSNPGFCHFCPKQCIYLCMVLAVIIKDKILWILFRHLHQCICDFPILITSNFFHIEH